MSQRLIPRSDRAFATKLGCFARNASKDPARFSLTLKEAEELTAASERFEAALLKAHGAGTCSRIATMEKDNARAEAERLYKRCVAKLRAMDELDAATRMAAGMREPSDRKRPRVVPQEPPDMRFVRALHVGSSAAAMHELRFCALNSLGKSKPDGATRLELFVDLVGPDEPVPGHPGENHGGRPWYLRSFTRSPIRITPPMARVPMLVVYWGRWADATGNVGPWCRTVVSRVEGMSAHVWQAKKLPMMDNPPAPREEKYSVSVRDAQYEYLNQADVSPPPTLPAPADAQGETRQLEGPPQREAA